jgi:hypothetical protein
MFKYKPIGIFWFICFGLVFIDLDFNEAVQVYSLDKVMIWFFPA